MMWNFVWTNFFFCFKLNELGREVKCLFNPFLCSWAQMDVKSASEHLFFFTSISLDDHDYYSDDDDYDNDKITFVPFFRLKIFTTILLIRFLFFMSLQVLSLVIHESLGQNFYKTFLHPAQALTLTQQYRQMWRD